MQFGKSFVFLAALFLIITAAPTSFAQPEGEYTDVRVLPEGLKGERISGLLRLFETGDSDEVRAFINKYFTDAFRDVAPMDQHLEVFRGIYAQSHGFEFYGIRKYAADAPPGEHVVVVRNKLTQAWQAFVVRIQGSPPHKIAGVQFMPARAPKEFSTPKALTDDEIVEELEAFVKRLTKADVFSGTVLLARDGKVLFRFAGGQSSKRFNVFNQVDTKFNLGSMNKMFTGVSIAQLVQRGALSFDDPLSKFLSEDWLSAKITDKVLIEHLLTHTSGLGSYFNEKFMKSSRLLFRKLDDYKPLIRGETLAFEPGTRRQYSNTGMFLLGVVIEKVTGQDYFEYVRENIYEPAGMENTDCYEMDRPVPNLAIGYSREGDGWTNNIYKHVVKGGPAGGGFSTVEDLLKFDQALRGHKLLNEKYTEMVWSGKPGLNSPSYGFGFGVFGKPDDRIVGHSGGFSGINSNLDMFLDSGYTAVVMSNYDMGAQPVQEKMRELIATRK